MYFIRDLFLHEASRSFKWLVGSILSLATIHTSKNKTKVENKWFFFCNCTVQSCLLSLGDDKQSRIKAQFGRASDGAKRAFPKVVLRFLRSRFHGMIRSHWKKRRKFSGNNPCNWGFRW